jgi:hypothetical protein
MQLINQYNVDIKIGRVLEYFQRDNRHRQRVSAWNAKYRFHVLFYIVCVQMCMRVFMCLDNRELICVSECVRVLVSVVLLLL